MSSRELVNLPNIFEPMLELSMKQDPQNILMYVHIHLHLYVEPSQLHNEMTSCCNAIRQRQQIREQRQKQYQHNKSTCICI